MLASGMLGSPYMHACETTMCLPYAWLSAQNARCIAVSAHQIICLLYASSQAGVPDVLAHLSDLNGLWWVLQLCTNAAKSSSQRAGYHAAG